MAEVFLKHLTLYADLLVVQVQNYFCLFPVENILVNTSVTSESCTRVIGTEGCIMPINDFPHPLYMYMYIAYLCVMYV